MRKFLLLHIILLCFSVPISLTGQVRLTAELQDDNRTYLVKIRPEVSYAVPFNITNSAQVAFVLPTGCYTEGAALENINGSWRVNNVVTAPTENPSKDYVSFELQSPILNIDYQAGQEVPLFSFQHAGDCATSLEFVAEEDPFFPPNSEGVNIGISVIILGAGGNAYIGTYTNGDNGGDGGQNTDDCEDNFTFEEENTCPYGYILDAENGVFTVSILSDTTLNPPFNTTSTAQITLKVPTGSLSHLASLGEDQLTYHIDGVNFSISRTNAPSESPEFDYISFTLATLGTRDITYEKGRMVSLFSFNNEDNCTGGPVTFMEMDDPFTNNPSVDANQQITIFGIGSNVSPCISRYTITDCGVMEPCDMVEPNIQRDTLFTSIPTEGETRVCLGDKVQLQSINSASLCNDVESLSIAPISESDCITITPNTSFSGDELACIVHCDSDNVCDTTIINLCPKVNLMEDISLCEGESVQLSPTTGGEGTYSWTTTSNISCTDCPMPTISPTETTTYIVEYTTPNGCPSSDTLMVTVVASPVIAEVTALMPSDCEENGSITIRVEESQPAILYSIDNGTTFQRDSLFANLGQGSYQVVVRDTVQNCTTTYDEVVELSGADSPITINDVLSTSPNACEGTTGSIMIMTTVDVDITPEYSIDNGMTWSSSNNFSDLSEGNYQVLVRAQEIECSISYQNNPIELVMPAAARILSNLEPLIFCEEDDRIVRITLNKPISEFNIDGGNFSNAEVQDSVLTFEAISEEGMVNYSITLTDENGCMTNGEQQVMVEDCNAEFPSCGLFDDLDTLQTFLERDTAIACLPIPQVDIAEFVFLKDGEPHEPTIGECDDSFVQAGFIPEALGPPPYLLEEWAEIGVDTLKDITFNTIEELIVIMNDFAPTGNWVITENDGFVVGISGIANSGVYGPLFIRASDNVFSDFNLNPTDRSLQSLILQDLGVHTFVLVDTINRCQDTLIVKVGEEMENPPTEPSTSSDTLRLTTSTNTPILDYCLTNSSTMIDSITIDDCARPTNGSLLIRENYCFDYTPNTDFIGSDTFCVIICTPSRCDTTHVFVDVKSNEFEIFNGFSPNNDGTNDFFTINNIESSPDNHLQIFNRWGNRVYEKENYINDWDGTFDNLLLPDGIYFYLLEVVIDGQQQTHSGHVEIIR